MPEDHIAESSQDCLPQVPAADRGYVLDRRTLRLTPAEGGSGSTNVSIERDRELAER